MQSSSLFLDYPEDGGTSLIQNFGTLYQSQWHHILEELALYSYELVIHTEASGFLLLSF